MSYLGLQAGVFAPSGSGDLFFLASVAGIRDLRTVEDPRRQQTGVTRFLKNGALAGAAIDLPALRGVNWYYAVGAGLS